MNKAMKNNLGIILFLTPALVIFFVFFVYPVFFVASTSLVRWDGITDITFVGVNNYISLFKDSTFIKSVTNNLKWSMSGGFIHVPMAMFVALLLSSKPKGWKILRTIYFFPNIISIIALSMMWMAMYNNEYGAVNALLRAVGLEHLQRNWLGDLHTAFPALIAYWIFYIGYFMVIILAEISTIPESYYEAASIDGANRIQQTIYITLPMIKGIMGTCITLSMVSGLKQFEQVFIMTNGGPANRTTLLALYLYKQMINYRYGLANAAGVMLLTFGVIVIFTIKKIFSANKIEQVG